MDDYVSCFIRRRELTMERSQLQYTKNPVVQHYVMQSSQAFTFNDLFMLWDPVDESAAETKINELRALAGLSPWTFIE